MSSKITIIPYRPGHLDLFKPRKAFSDIEDLDQRLLSLYHNPSARTGTLILDGRVIGVIGLAPLFSGVAEAWTVLSDDIRKSPLSFHKFIKSRLESFTKELKIRRVQCTVRDDFETGQRWALSLGFRHEGRMRGFSSDGVDSHLFARISPWQPR